MAGPAPAARPLAPPGHSAVHSGSVPPASPAAWRGPSRRTVSPAGCAQGSRQLASRMPSPPLHLIPRVVQHALDTDSRLVLLVPNWPSQPWWPKLMSITARSWLVGRKSDLFSRRAQSGEAWGKVPVLRPFFELLVCLVHASSAAASTPASAEVSSGLRLTAVAASDPVVGAVPRIRCPPGTLVPPM